MQLVTNFRGSYRVFIRNGWIDDCDKELAIWALPNLLTRIK